MALKKTLQGQSLYFSPSIFSDSSLISSKGPKQKRILISQRAFYYKGTESQIHPFFVMQVSGKPLPDDVVDFDKVTMFDIINLKFYISNM